MVPFSLSRNYSIPASILLFIVVSMEDIERLLAILELPSALSQNVHSSLLDFIVLPEIDRENGRTQTIEKIFPIVFGDNALIKASATYQSLLKSTW